MEPSVSEPMAKPTQPAATALAGPADEPLEPCVGVPWIARLPAKPLVAHGQRAQRELGHQHGAGLVEPLDHGRVLVDDRCSNPPAPHVVG